MAPSFSLASALGRVSALFRVQQVMIFRGGPPKTKVKKSTKAGQLPKKQKVNVKKRVVKEEGGDSKSGRASTRPVDHSELLTEVLIPKEKRIVNLSEEELSQRRIIAKVWSMYQMRKHHEHAGILNRFIRCRQRAMSVLENIRPDLAKRAKYVDNSPYPISKGPPSITPPVDQAS